MQLPRVPPPLVLEEGVDEPIHDSVEEQLEYGEGRYGEGRRVERG